MTTALSTQTHVILYRTTRIYATQEQADAIIREIVNGQKTHIVFDGQLLPTRDLAVLKAENVEFADKIKRGDWKCDYDEWHTRGHSCGHTKPR